MRSVRKYEITVIVGAMHTEKENSVMLAGIIQPGEASREGLRYAWATATAKAPRQMNSGR